MLFFVTDPHLFIGHIVLIGFAVIIAINKLLMMGFVENVNPPMIRIAIGSAFWSCEGIAIFIVRVLFLHAFVHRSGGVDDKHRCRFVGVLDAFGLHAQCDLIGVVLGVGISSACGGLADGYDPRNDVGLRRAGALLPCTVVIIVAIDHSIVGTATVCRQYVQRQQGQGHHEDQDPGEKALANFLLRHKKILLLLPVRREEGGR